MAWGLPAAMGMALARPEERVVALSGDGSRSNMFYMRDSNSSGQGA